MKKKLTIPFTIPPKRIKCLEWIYNQGSEKPVHWKLKNIEEVSWQSHK